MSDEPKTIRYKRGESRDGGARHAHGAEGTLPYERKGKLGQRVGEQVVSPHLPPGLREQDETRPAKLRSESGETEAEVLVVGWLAVESGPGRGRSFPLYNRRNSLGRDPREDVALTFSEGEDNAISRTAHCFIGFEPKKSLFIAEKGEGNNYTYVNGDVVLGHRILAPYDRIEIGNTVLVFVPLCGDRFQWHTSASAADR
ncbi:MAG TPA: FHA domain-containing protein [Gammaproteobacteria bacterium]